MKNKFRLYQLHYVFQNNRYVLSTFQSRGEHYLWHGFPDTRGHHLAENHGKSPSYIYDAQPTTDGGFIAVGENKGEEVVANLWVLN